MCDMNGNSNTEVHIFDPQGFERLEDLVQRYRVADSLLAKQELFHHIALEVTPVIEWVSHKSGWLATVGESDVDAITSEFVLKLPRVLDGYRADSGFKLFSYLVKSIENTFRKLLRKKRNLDKHIGDWPRDRDGALRDVEDCSSTFASNESAQQRSDEFEALMFRIPLEIAEGLPHANIIRYVARRYLDQADNAEQLYISELSAEVAKLPCHTLDERQIECLVRATIAGVRARLYNFRRSEDTDNRPGREAAEELLKGLFRAGDPKLWPFLLILEPSQTLMLLSCVAGIVPSCPPRGRWYRRSGTVRLGANGNGDHLTETMKVEIS